MLWPDQQLFRQFKVDGRGADTGRKRQRVYEALDEQNLVEVAAGDGTIIEAYEEIDPKPPSERQLEYAEKLGIKSIPPKASFYEVSNLINQAIKKDLVLGGRAAGLPVPDNLTYEQGRDLEELLWCTDDGEKKIWRHSSLPTEIEVRNARTIGVCDITEFTSAAMVFARAWEHLNSKDDKAVLAAWFIYNVYIDLASGGVHESLMPKEALSNKPAQRRFNFNLLAVNSFRQDQASFGQILPLLGRNLVLFWAILPLVGTRLPSSRLA